MNSYYAFRYFAMAAGCCLMAVAFGQDERSSESADPQGRIIEYDSTPEQVVIRMDVNTGASNPENEMPYLQIFGDGLMVVHRPAGTGGPGLFEKRLSTTDLDDLFAYLDDCGVLAFNAIDVEKQVALTKETRQKVAARNGTQLPFKEAVGGSSTSIKVFLKRYRPAGPSDETISNYRAEATWYALQFSALEYPEIQPLVHLAEAARTLDLMANDAARMEP
jgi:hypothetical protein